MRITILVVTTLVVLACVVVVHSIQNDLGRVKCHPNALSPGPCTTPILVINMDHRPDKWGAVTARLRALDPTVLVARSPGVNLVRDPQLLRESPYTVGRGARAGQAGLTLAHLRAWETVARDYSDFVLILEDDARPLSISVCDKARAAAPEHDIILLNQLRPRARGRILDASLCLHDVQPQTLRMISKDRLGIVRKISNAWTSSYMISPRGVHKMLALLRRDPIAVDREEFDVAWMRRLMRRSHDIRVAVIGQTGRYFHHTESDSDKVAQNGVD